VRATLSSTSRHRERRPTSHARPARASPPATPSGSSASTWWDDRAADTPAGFTEAVWIIARHLGIECAALRGQKPIKTDDR
jgi:hypothetical protein